MIPMMKLLPLAAALPLVFAGCTSTNPKSAFDDVGKHVAARTGQEVRWMRDDSERGEMEQAVAALLQTNLTAPSAVAIALLNNRTLQAEFESVGISQAELAQASRLRTGPGRGGAAHRGVSPGAAPLRGARREHPL